MSDITFTCPKCKQPLEGDDSMGGQVVECPSCNTQVIVPSGQKKKIILSKSVSSGSGKKSSLALIVGIGFGIVAIILVIIAVLVFTGQRQQRQFLGGDRHGQSQESKARSSIASIGLALDLYETDNGNFPASLQSLLTKGSEQNWRGPYLKSGQIPIDPWGHEFVYTLKANGYEVRSPGPNGVAGDTDDVTN